MAEDDPNLLGSCWLRGPPDATPHLASAESRRSTVDHLTARWLGQPAGCPPQASDLTQGVSPFRRNRGRQPGAQKPDAHPRLAPGMPVADAKPVRCQLLTESGRRHRAAGYAGAGLFPRKRSDFGFPATTGTRPGSGPPGAVWPRRYRSVLKFGRLAGCSR
jgi:hypothetical protein